MATGVTRTGRGPARGQPVVLSDNMGVQRDQPRAVLELVRREGSLKVLPVIRGTDEMRE